MYRYDLTFSGTAEWVVGLLLAVAILSTLFI
jgi:hypothetical protein